MRRTANARTLLVALTASLAATLTGCQVVERTHGSTGIVARYNGFDFNADLPAETTVPAIVAAAEASFRDMGYTVVSSTSTEQSGTVVGRPPRLNDYPIVRVRAVQRDGAIRVYINKEPINEEALVRGVLSRILEKLGL